MTQSGDGVKNSYGHVTGAKKNLLIGASALAKF